MRLLSYNIHKGIGGRDRRYRFNRIIDVIEAENPDIVCLQEVDRHVRRSRFHDQPKLLTDAFHYVSHLFQLNVHLRTGGYGNLLLSRWPLVSKHQISLRLNTRKPRGAQLAVVDSPEGPIHVVHFHLGLSERERHWQIDHLLHHHLFRESEHLPTIVAGDFNDWRNSLSLAALHVHGFHQVTSPPSRFRSFPAVMPVASLDKLFTRGDLAIKRAHFVHSRLARAASDHLPLVVDFHANGHGV
jgi:endonuclease/exonuclease/phosphatase family metal-dependent hydrolase